MAKEALSQAAAPMNPCAFDKNESDEHTCGDQSPDERRKTLVPHGTPFELVTIILCRPASAVHRRAVLASRHTERVGKGNPEIRVRCKR
ncbi:MAG TPA: hypothetical protein VGR43_02545, partial [Dehalococcoidia bacterium]|nr:hypothetical protein [Dehalococcoidia bacterium]